MSGHSRRAGTLQYFPHTPAYFPRMIEHPRFNYWGVISILGSEEHLRSSTLPPVSHSTPCPTSQWWGFKQEPGLGLVQNRPSLAPVECTSFGCHGFCNSHVFPTCRPSFVKKHSTTMLPLLRKSMRSAGEREGRGFAYKPHVKTFGVKQTRTCHPCGSG